MARRSLANCKWSNICQVQPCRRLWPCVFCQQRANSHRHVFDQQRAGPHRRVCAERRASDPRMQRPRASGCRPQRRSSSFPCRIAGLEWRRLDLAGNCLRRSSAFLPGGTCKLSSAWPPSRRGFASSSGNRGMPRPLACPCAWPSHRTAHHRGMSVTHSRLSNPARDAWTFRPNVLPLFVLMLDDAFVFGDVTCVAHCSEEDVHEPRRRLCFLRAVMDG